jgi:hypothetical protein
MRLPGPDYKSPDAYFITAYAKNWEPLFGEVVDGEMRLSDYGWIVQVEWLRAPMVRRYAALDSFVVMPNQFNAILRPFTGSVETAVGQFKAAVTKQINHVRGTPAAEVWQESHIKRILSTEDEFTLASHFVAGNCPLFA